MDRNYKLFKHLNVLLFKKLHLRSVKNKARTKHIPHVNEEVERSIADGKMTIRRHSGSYRYGTASLPEVVINALKIIITGDGNYTKTLLEDGSRLCNYLHTRSAPAENKTIQRKYNEILSELEQKNENKLSAISGNQREVFEQKLQTKANNLLKRRVYNWSAIDYTPHVGKQYMLCRMAAEYAALNSIFLEISIRDNNFKPTTLFDFGSGVGTVIWAAKKFWSNSLKEFYCVDSSADMNDLSKLILQNGVESTEPIDGVFYRQFLPSTSKMDYDVVISSYSLLELPSMEARCETLLKLWNKTKNYLVIVEIGNIPGFNVVAEARSIITDFEKQHPDSTEVHVFSPCPHELPCPFLKLQHPCSFKVPYYRVPIGVPEVIQKERFSYVILKRGKRMDNDMQWPRVIRPTKKRSKHCICHLCHKDGKLINIVISKGKQGTKIHQIARSTKWGDQLPMDITEHIIDDEDIEEFTGSFDSSDEED